MIVIEAVFCLGYKTKRYSADYEQDNILDTVFTATSKFELMRTVIGFPINMVEREKSTTAEKAMQFPANSEVMDDFFHIVLDGVHDSIRKNIYRQSVKKHLTL